VSRPAQIRLTTKKPIKGEVVPPRVVRIAMECEAVSYSKRCYTKCNEWASFIVKLRGSTLPAPVDSRPVYYEDGICINPRWRGQIGNRYSETEVKRSWTMAALIPIPTWLLWTRDTRFFIVRGGVDVRDHNTGVIRSVKGEAEMSVTHMRMPR
jgi:hypothetical protein